MRQQKMTLKFSLMLATAGIFGLTACTDPYGGTGGQPSNTQSAAVAGALIGGVFGATRKGDDKLAKTATGALVGGAIGGLIGNQLDKQAAEIKSQVDPRIQVVNTGDRLIVTMPEGILFATGSAAVNASVQNDLFAVADTLNRYPDSTVQVIGHTDSVGSAAFNQDLSQRRASSVAAILQSGNVSPGRLVAFGRGEDQPVASNLTPEGRQQNRRVEIVIIPNR
jgi:outer membrane protein OmpA-like peptidoglycan-associated protein